MFYFFFDLGNSVGPSLCTFISTPSGDWRWSFWWLIIANFIIMVLWIAVVPDTNWDRTPGAVNPEKPQGFVAERVATYLPGYKTMPRLSATELLNQCLLPIKIALTPVTICMILFNALNFGFYPAMNSIAPTYLQKTVAAGGYGFTPFQNALFQFFHWAGVGLALLYGQLISDRLPLWIAARFNHGAWKPEYRLNALWFPALVCNPIGIGIWGYLLQDHKSWGLLGLAQILVVFGSLGMFLNQ
jgi:hypothetical protein